jgi:hypothetical protein
MHTFLHFKNHQFTLILKTIKNSLKNLPLHVSVHIYDHLQGAHEQCFMPPEDGRKYGPKHAGASFFKMFLSVLSVNPYPADVENMVSS